MRKLSTIKRDLQVIGYKELIASAQELLLKKEQQDCPVVHSFGPGIYMREVTLKKGCFAVGHFQRFEHQNIVIKGHVRMLNPDGSTFDIVGPTMFVGTPGQKMGYIIEDTVWLNVYSTDETDVEKLESTFLDKNTQWLDYVKTRIENLRDTFQEARDDYLLLLKEFGISHAQARYETEITADLIDFPLGSYQVRVDESPIEGRGLFATSNIEAGAVICPARLDGRRTPAGRFTNHSNKPNARFVKNDHGDLYLVSTRSIEGCKGGTIGEELTVDYREALELNNRRRLCQVL